MRIANACSLKHSASIIVALLLTGCATSARCPSFVRNDGTSVNLKGLALKVGDAAGATKGEINLGELGLTPVKLREVSAELQRQDLAQNVICRQIDQIADPKKREDQRVRYIDALHELLGTVESAATRRLELFFQEYDRNTVVQAKHLIVRNGAKLVIHNGSTVVFEADTLEIEGRAHFTGPGARGSDGARGVCCPLSPIGAEWVSRDHQRWLEAGGLDNPHPHDRGGVGEPGGTGGNGATVQFLYKTMVGNSSGLTFNLTGGPGGRGGGGGDGRLLRCGTHPHETKRGKSGDPGPDGRPGRDGTFVFTRRT